MLPLFMICLKRKTLKLKLFGFNIFTVDVTMFFGCFNLLYSFLNRKYSDHGHAIYIY
jgi:hypothetical protein